MATDRDPFAPGVDPAERLAILEARMDRVLAKRQAREAEASAKRARAAELAEADRRVVLAEQSRAGHARRALRREGSAMHPLRRARIDAALTLQQLSDLSGVPRSSVAAAERGGPSSARTLTRIRRALGLDDLT